MKDAAARLGLSPTTLRVQIHNGRLRAVKRGRDWFVTAAALDAYATTVARRAGREDRTDA